MRRLAICLAVFSAFSCARAQEQETMIHLSNRVFALAEVQTVYMDSLLPEGRCPRTFQGDTLVTSDIGWWTSGFYPGVLWTLFKETGDETFRVSATTSLEELWIRLAWMDGPSPVPSTVPSARRNLRSSHPNTYHL